MEKYERFLNHHHFPLTMGSLVQLGGIMGFLASKSVASLTSSTIVAFPFFLSAYWMREGQYKEANIAGLASGLALLGISTPNLFKNARMPILFFLGSFATVYHGYPVWQDNQDSKTPKTIQKDKL